MDEGRNAPGPDGPTRRLALARGPALITLGVTLLRLLLEFAGAPGWLASRSPGGAGALVGITWLPLAFGPWFALRIWREVPGTKRRIWRLASTLAVYGWLARIPVYLLFVLDHALGWNTHYAAFPGDAAQAGFLRKALLLAVAQFGFWPLVWTVIVGSVAGLVALAISRPRPAPAAPTAAGR